MARLHRLSHGEQGSGFLLSSVKYMPQVYHLCKQNYHNQGGELSSRKRSIDVCFSLLDLDPECSEEDLRLAYLEKVSI